MDNLEILKQTGLLEKQTRPLDVGGYAPQFAGQVLQVWVNPPALYDDFVNASADHGGRDMDKWRRVVSILFEMPLEAVQAMDDDLVTWLFTNGYRVYDEYHEELKKTSAAN